MSPSTTSCLFKTMVYMAFVTATVALTLDASQESMQPWQLPSVSSSCESSDALAVQMSTEGGKIYRDGIDYFLVLNGVGEAGLAVKDPTKPESARQIRHSAIEPMLPRFSMIITNSSQTPLKENDEIPFKSLILLDLVDNGPDSLKYKVDMIAPHTMDETVYEFSNGMVMVDLTPDGLATEDDEVVDGDHDKSLRWLMDNTEGLQTGKVPVPISKNGTEVTAQGVISTAFLGPFNAWAWLCCGYKIATAWTVIFPWSWIFWPLCCA